mgnify:CR=1 FL=1
MHEQIEVKRCIENDLLVISGIENNLSKYFESKDFQDKVFYRWMLQKI